MSTSKPQPTLCQNIADTFHWQLVRMDDFPTLTFVKVGRKAVAIPHLSYALWPPTDSMQRETLEFNLDQLYAALNAQFPSWELRLPTVNSAVKAEKTASWLDVNNIRYGSHLRSKLNRASRKGFKHVWGSAELVPEFWKFYARHIHKLGSFPLPLLFFEKLLKGFENGNAEICLLYKDQIIVGAACNLHVQGFYENVWFATNVIAQKAYGSYYLHQQMITRSRALGCNTYSFGRSTTGSGVHAFKKQWGAVDIPLEWHHSKTGINFLHKFKGLGSLLSLLPFWFVAWLGGKMAYRIY